MKGVSSTKFIPLPPMWGILPINMTTSEHAVMVEERIVHDRIANCQAAGIVISCERQPFRLKNIRDRVDKGSGEPPSDCWT
jgi:hypothetical protein